MPQSILRAKVTADDKTFGTTNPVPTMTLGDQEVDLNAFDVEYANTDHAGTATVTITPKETNKNYTDTAKGTFTVKPASLEGATIEGIAQEGYVFTGKAIKPAVTVKLNGTLLDPENYIVSYKDNVKAGTAVVTVSGKGDYTGAQTASYTIRKVAIDSAGVSVAGIADKTANGSEQTQDALVLKLGDYTLTSEDYTVEYANNIAVGEATITIKAAQDGSLTGTRTEHFYITQLTMSEIAAATYTGEAITPKPAIKDVEIELDEGADFEYEYTNNTNAGTATVTAKGIGAYAGKNVSTQSVISPAPITGVNVEGDFAYTGEAHAPEPTVRAKVGDETCTLTKGEDYIVEYRNNVNAGDASVIVTGKGNFGGARGTVFTIEAQSIAEASIDEIPDQTFSGKELKPAVTVKLGDETLDPANYTVSYANNVKAGKNSATVTVTAKKGTNYTGTASRTFSINRLSLEGAQVGAIADQTYTGSVIEPAINVSLGGKTLTKGTDYKVAYAENTDRTSVGKVKFTITGMGNYQGELEGSFNIVARSVEDATVEGVSSTTYTGQVQTPNPTVKIGETPLTSSDYDVVYAEEADRTNVGRVELTVTGKGNYTGKKTVEFTINPAVITSIEDIADQTYTNGGKAITPTLTVKAGDLVLDKDDYTATYLNNVNAGGATVSVAGKGNFTGTASTTFTIGAPSSEDLFIGAVADKTYTGSEIEPAINVSLGSETLRKGTDYKIKYENNKDVGIATATIEPVEGSKFTGSRTIMFNILPAQIGSVEGVKNATFTGEAIECPLTVKAGVVTPSNNDYTIAYENNTHAGQATVTVTGKGNFTGSVRKSFTIEPQSISGFTVVIPESPDGTGVYTERSDLSPYEPVPTVYTNADMAEGHKLAPTNYDVSYSDNVVAGDATVTVTGKGDYTGTKTGKFTIAKYAGSAASDGPNSVIWYVEDDGAMTIEPKKDGLATLGSASSLAWSQAVADYTTKVVVDKNVTGCNDTSGMFSGLTNVKSVDISEFNTNQVTNMSGMFEGCESLTADGIKGSLDTSNVSDMSNMFAGCTSLESIPLSSIDTSGTKNLSGMFRGCTSLTSLEFSQESASVQTSAVSAQGRRMLRTFSRALNSAAAMLTGTRDAPETGNMSGMFEGCTGLTELDLSSFKTSDIGDMSNMFAGCTSLKTLNLSSFDTQNVTNMTGMFNGCTLSEFIIGENYMNTSSNNITVELPEPSESTGMW